MIKANELRKGNLVQTGIIEKVIIEVKTIHEDGVNETFSEFDLDYPDSPPLRNVRKFEDLEPIPLTAEILERYGFTYTASFGECRFSKDELEMDENFNPLVQEKDEYLFYGKRIDYLHELQNFYYDLNKKELEIKELQHT